MEVIAELASIGRAVKILAYSSLCEQLEKAETDMRDMKYVRERLTDDVGNSNATKDINRLAPRIEWLKGLKESLEFSLGLSAEAKE